MTLKVHLTTVIKNKLKLNINTLFILREQLKSYFLLEKFRWTLRLYLSDQF